MRPAKAYDPRDLDQILSDPSTWKETENRALVTASKRPERGEDYWRGVAMLAEMWDIDAREDVEAERRTEMAKKPGIEGLRELGARALCRLAGNPENSTFEGNPMWMSYLPEVDAVFSAINLAGMIKKAEDQDR
jgi:hypothetical protein